MDVRILHGDAATMLRTLPAGCCRTCVTSPPYYGLRDYGVDGQIGLEETPEAFVDSLVAVFREVWRVLADNGTAWVNLGDSYNGSTQSGGDSPRCSGGQKRLSDLHATQGHVKASIKGLKPKDLIGIPWLVAFALRADGWYLRSDIIWAKPNPMPESVTDRPTKAHEYVFLLAKSAKYYYDAGAISEEPVTKGLVVGKKGASWHDHNDDLIRGDRRSPECNGKFVGEFGRNKRDVWEVATQPYPEAHFATYPEKLIEPCILAGSAPGDTVLDPFTGSGTTGAVSVRLGRNFIGCELNAEYITLAQKRIGKVTPPLFAMA